MDQGYGGGDYGMRQGMGWAENGDPELSFLLDLLSLAPMEKPPPTTPRAGLAPAALPPPSAQGEAAQACTG